MVISVFNTAPGLQAYQGSRRARLQDQALRTEQEAMARRQAAFNNMLGQIQDPQRRAEFEMAGPQGALALIAQRDEQKAAQRAAQAEADATRRQAVNEYGNTVATRMRAQGIDPNSEQGQAFLQNAYAYGQETLGMQMPPELFVQRVTNPMAGELQEAPNRAPQRGVNPETGRVEYFRLNAQGAPEFLGVQAPPSGSGGPSMRVTGYDEMGRPLMEYGYGGDSVTPAGQGTRGAGLGPQTSGEADRRTAALDESNVRAGPVDEYFRLTGRLTEAGSGGAGFGARLIQETGAQIGGGVSVAEYLVTGDAQLGPDIIRRGNEILQDITGLDASDTARLRSNQILVRSKLLPLVAGGLGQRYTDFENELAGQVLGDINDPAASFETMQGNRSAVYAALAVQDARAAIASDVTPSYNVVTPAGQPNPEGAREMMRVLQQDYGFSEDEAYGIYEGYARSLIQLYQRPRRQLIEDVEAIRSAQEELANQ